MNPFCHRIAVPALLALSAAVPSSHAAVSSVATYDNFVFDAKNDPYGSSDIRGPAYAPGQGSAAMSVRNPSGVTPEGLPYSFQGQLASGAYTVEGINRAFAQTSSDQVVVDGDRLTGVYGGSGWHDAITVTGGTGSGVLTLTARLEGTLDVKGPLNSQGLNGAAGASLHFMRSATPLNAGEDPFEVELAFACGPQDSPCWYDTERFSSLASLPVEAREHRAYDESVTFDIPFTYGETFYLFGTLETAAYAFNVGASASADFFNTGRIVAFQAPDGARVSLGSGQYANFALPVPEPLTAWQALTGIAVLAAWSARRRRCAHRMG